ncbi:putative nudix hydrolase [Pseudomonas phage pPa_SNUABM_DT01]|nr:putative nudix hydrolase [Pseudomonas phage pPa_SNUABM_DT01]
MQQVRVGVGVIIMRDNKILMGKRKGSHGAGCYSVPGGHLEFGENIGACAKREVLEETGIVLLDPLVQGGYTNDIFSEEGKHYATLFVVSRFNEGEAQNLEPEKCDGWAWYDMADLPQPLFLPFQNYMDKVHEHLFGREKLTA